MTIQLYSNTEHGTRIRPLKEFSIWPVWPWNFHLIPCILYTQIYFNIFIQINCPPQLQARWPSIVSLAKLKWKLCHWCIHIYALLSQSVPLWHCPCFRLFQPTGNECHNQAQACWIYSFSVTLTWKLHAPLSAGNVKRLEKLNGGRRLRPVNEYQKGYTLFKLVGRRVSIGQTQGMFVVDLRCFQKQ